MSSNRLSYDACAYKDSLRQSTDPLNYMLYTGKYDNSAKCRIEFGVVGGNGVSLFTGNLVDLESDLRGQTRLASNCSSKLYHPSEHNTHPHLSHQPSCQMQNYPTVPISEKKAYKGCSKEYSYSNSGRGDQPQYNDEYNQENFQGHIDEEHMMKNINRNNNMNHNVHESFYGGYENEGYVNEEYENEGYENQGYDNQEYRLY